uniref:Acylneuraminate cytidylyltransferase family protein n=1 Tax=candidate division CPR3 bacterium TaxID=2268181 RepID=A0A7V3N452_UNCC3
MKNCQILALVPARGGSKGVPHKNIKELAGKPLIAYTIEEARKSKYISRIVVSTDDPRIARIATKYGAEVPFLRPKRLAKDNTPTLPVLRHAIEYLMQEEGYSPEVVVLLQPTTPLRTHKSIDRGIEMFFKNNRQTLISVTQVKENPYWMKVLRGRFLYPFIKTSAKYLRRQDLPRVYLLNGALYITETRKLMRTDPFNGKAIGFVMDRSESLDIDEEEDFLLAEAVFKKIS